MSDENSFDSVSSTESLHSNNGAAQPIENVSAEALVRNFEKILKNPEDQDAFRRAISGKSSAWEYKHKGSYYKAKYALQFKEVVDGILKDGKARIYRYRDYPEFSRPRSLYLKIVQSRAYLLDKLDSEGKYKLLCDAILLTTKYKVGIILSLQRDLLDGYDDDKFHKPDILGDEDDPWREQLDTYLSSEKKPEGKFEAKGLMLDDNEQRDLEIMLSGLANVSYRITQDKVLVVRES